VVSQHSNPIFPAPQHDCQRTGIHGRPYQSWDGSNGAGGVHYDTGYCAHDSVLFPTWHRPYLALFEQRVHAYATQIAAASTGTDRNARITAANNLRIPYWDWASNHNIPDVVSSQKISVKIPCTTQKTGSCWTTVDNPLYTWKMQKPNANLFPTNDPNDGQVARYSFTVRQPSSTASNAASNNGQANAALGRLNLKGNIYNLLTSNIGFYQMASQSNPGTSLESIHGNVHVAVGGNGHMTQLSYAAFDPIFWLHHTNCDRLFAIWQALNPTKWIPATGEPGVFTWTNNGNNRDYSGNGLTPFSKNTAGTHWNSDASRSMSAFGYTYPEINDWSQSAAQLRTSVVASVNKLYGPGSNTPGRKNRRQAGSGGEAATSQWYASIGVLKQALPTGFTVSVFLGTPPTSSLDWQTASNLCGSLSVFPPPSGLPAPHASVQSWTELALDKALQTAGYVETDDATTAAYLQANLAWRVNTHDISYTPIDPASIPSLNVTVYEKEVVTPDSAFQLPTYSAPKHHPEITSNKKSGGGKHH
jgi:tyrosinase